MQALAPMIFAATLAIAGVAAAITPVVQPVAASVAVVR